jgi:hypothetical protein
MSDRQGAALTNAEAAAFVREWRDVSPSPSRLWYQFAAVAYGWSPSSDKLNRGKAQGKKWYRPELLAELWEWARGIARALDEEADSPPPRVSVNRDTFDDLVFYGEVKQSLQDDGARAQFKIPMPSCRDKKTGKMRFPLVTDKPGDCESVLVDDPVTFLGSKVSTLLLIAGVVWVLTRPSRRTKGT